MTPFFLATRRGRAKTWTVEKEFLARKRKTTVTGVKKWDNVSCGKEHRNGRRIRKY